MRERLSTILRIAKRFALLVGILAIVQFAWVFVSGGIESGRSADCIVVPGAAVWANRTPSDALAYRLERAAALYREGRAPFVIVTGGGEGNYAEAVVMAEWLGQRGVPEGALIIENESGTTRESGANVAKLMRARGFQSALVVSQWFHVGRTRLCLAQEGMETLPVPCGGNTLVKEPWFVAREMIALPAYALRLDELR
ncbi:MAG: YdcF family protein [Planctomycetes bacterium]|nr:YdcF family protein [Planctomycetota bacterium]